jgi:ribonuclease R
MDLHLIITSFYFTCRYPDVIWYTVCYSIILDGGKSVDEELYETKCLHCSTMEGLATNAERDSIYTWLNTCKIIKMKNWELFLTEWGIYVEI